MKKRYLNLMEKALARYELRQIKEYITNVRENGLKEHGFPRLCANIGILIANGRCLAYKDIFCEMMDICCTEMPKVKAANDFSVKEICFAIDELYNSDVFTMEQIDKWVEDFSEFTPNMYNKIAEAEDKPAGNWCAFAGVSEYARCLLSKCDSTEFINLEIGSQMHSFDENSMYKDPNNPMVYDYVTRLQLAVLLHLGYDGKYHDAINKHLIQSGDITLKLQSVSGEIPYGGRSNQMVFNEALIAALCEFEASRYAALGDVERAGEFKAAALDATNTFEHCLDTMPAHVKNFYPQESRFGCEKYAYFNKYMITAASYIYCAYLFANDKINPTVSRARRGGLTCQTSKDFHKLVLNAGSYYLEFDTDADFHYDANGLGRIHKEGCASTIALSMPFPKHPNYLMPESAQNPTAMSLCSYVIKEGKLLLGAESSSSIEVISHCADSLSARAVIKVRLDNDTEVTESYTVSQSGIDIEIDGGDGIMLPAIYFDGAENSVITASDNEIKVSYRSSILTYNFDGVIENEEAYYNRNGEYRVFRMHGKSVHIEMS